MVKKLFEKISELVIEIYLDGAFSSMKMTLTRFKKKISYPRVISSNLNARNDYQNWYSVQKSKSRLIGKYLPLKNVCLFYAAARRGQKFLD